MMSNKLIFSLFLLSLFFNTVYSQQNPPIIYEISCALDVNKRVIEGREVIQLTNNSSSPVEKLYLNLFMNAFRDTRSTFFKEVILSGLKNRFKLEDAGWVDILSIKVGGHDLKKDMVFLCPDDGNTNDRTLALISLPLPIMPKMTISIEVEFSTKIPKFIKGSGYLENFFLVSNWYPKLCPLEEKGGEWFWNFHQLHFQPYFYSNFASYRVEINVPRNYKVGATGIKLWEKKIGRKKIARFSADNHSDFVWIASPSLLEYQEKFSPGKEAGLRDFRKFRVLADSDELREKVDIFLFLRPESKVYKDRYLNAVKNALKYYEFIFSRYPYPVITVVDLPSYADIDDYFYPNLIACDHPLFTPMDSLILEKEILRGLSYQYWRGVLRTNEIEEPWLSGGISTYSTLFMLREIFEKPVLYKYFSFLPVPSIELFNIPCLGFYFSKIRYDEVDFLLFEYFKEEPFEPILKKVWEFGSCENYRINSKVEPALILLMLERIYGQKRVLGFLRKFFREFAFKNASSDDFLNMMEKEIDVHARRIFEYFLFNSEPVDFRVVSVTNQKINQEGMFLSSIIIEKIGDLVLSLEVEIHFEGGEKVMEKWNGEGNWKRYAYIGNNKIEKVIIDPYQKFIMDSNRFNNSFLTKKNYLSLSKAFALFCILLGEFLHNLSFFI